MLSDTALLGLWHLTESADELLPALPEPTHYAGCQPTGRDANRLREWRAGRALAHALLPRLASPPARLHNDANGRPYFAELPHLAVSLSHSGEWAAALLATGGRAGTDIELVRPKTQRLAPRVLSAAELTDAGDEAVKHSLYWSAKETLYKLHSRRGLVFKEQILLDPFRLREAGVLTGHLLLENSRSQHQIHYRRLALDYVLTYCHELPGTTNHSATSF